jgi:Protein of unknown function DUF262
MSGQMMTTPTERLQVEIDDRAREIHTDGYSMSINEVVAMYQDGDLETHPEFQRIFRWTVEQQSRLIESIFLGIPIPPIFVAQRSDGVWDVVDGVQRLSTIFRFMGVLKDEKKELDKPVPLTAGEYLKNLVNVVWDDDVVKLLDNNKNLVALTEAQQRFVKRARLDIQIVQKESDDQAKFDLFQRLNSGTRLSEQEARNCLAVMLDPEFARWMDDLASTPAYESVMSISDRKAEEAYGTESVLRYLACAIVPMAELEKMGDFGEFLTNRMRIFIGDPDFNREYERDRFNFIFSELNESLGESAFKRYYTAGDRFAGAFSVSAFEAVTSGIARHYSAWLNVPKQERQEEFRTRVKSVWSDEVFSTRSGGGKRSNYRIPYMVQVGERIFKVE